MSFNLAPVNHFGRVKNPCGDCDGDVCTMNCSPREVIEEKNDPIDALERLIKIAKGDTGQSRRVADFLLSWWNAARDGGFDMTNLWNVDRTIADDMVKVFDLISRTHSYPDSLGYGPDFEDIVINWRGGPHKKGKRK